VSEGVRKKDKTRGGKRGMELRREKGSKKNEKRKL